ncbi:uncharacterized protein LOC135087399 [Ostrinia nubilalis]|uniref:uncharacterized protein LOC135081465 n=1 Tax=Ostrinia nubilalis TaxID=29057 RepID=UPI00308261AC
MEKLRFKFEVQGSADGKTNVICITSIETPDGRVYEIPDELKPASKHNVILTTELFTKIKNTLKKRHQTRSLWIPLNTELRKTYLDEGENVQFGNQYLDETTGEANASYKNSSMSENKNLGKTAERFVIEKFSNKSSSADQWINDFESECERFQIRHDEEKIGILKHLLEKQCLDWYASMLIKMSMNSDWAKWKNAFCETYGNKGWSQIKYAFIFKYQSGSLLEYATKKERLLLEANKNIDTKTLITLIVIGLPDYVMDKIDKETIKTTENLYNEIGKHESLIKKKYNNNYRKNTYEKNNYEYKGKMENEKKPCKICEKLNKGSRFHPEEKCWFKQTEEYNQKRNSGRTINNTVLDVELSNEEKKNE